MPALSSASSARESGVIAWLRLATHPATVRRAFITTLIVGTILIAINEGPIILAGEVTCRCITVLVPYIVSTVSSVSTRRELARRVSNPKQFYTSVVK